MYLVGELKRFSAKALISGDRSVRLEFTAIDNDKYPVNTNQLQVLMHKPILLQLEVIDLDTIIQKKEVDETAIEDKNSPQDQGCQDL